MADDGGAFLDSDDARSLRILAEYFEPLPTEAPLRPAAGPSASTLACRTNNGRCRETACAFDVGTRVAT